MRDDLARLRDIVHHYFEIDQQLIWQVVEQDLPPFKETVLAALQEIEGSRR